MVLAGAMAVVGALAMYVVGVGAEGAVGVGAVGAGGVGAEFNIGVGASGLGCRRCCVCVEAVSVVSIADLHVGAVSSVAAGAIWLSELEP